MYSYELLENGIFIKGDFSQYLTGPYLDLEFSLIEINGDSGIEYTPEGLFVYNIVDNNPEYFYIIEKNSIGETIAKITIENNKLLII